MTSIYSEKQQRPLSEHEPVGVATILGGRLDAEIAFTRRGTVINNDARNNRDSDSK